MNELRHKYRAFHKEQKKMYDVESICPYQDESTKGGEVFLVGIEKKSFYFPEEVELLDCIGKRDRNGKPIFEGDVVNAWYKNEYGNDQYDTYTVVYDDRIMGFAFKYKVHNEPICDIWSDEAFNSIDYEVIGNIYDNPELAEGDK